jgi:putative ATP-dependent endonuclease of the OLD family
MSEVRLNSISIKNYRSFGEKQDFVFPNADYKKPVAIVGYNNSGKTNLMQSILYGIGEKFLNEKTFERIDLHNLDYNNQIEIISKVNGTEFAPPKFNKPQTIAGDYVIKTTIVENEIKAEINKSFFGANKNYGIFYINFHAIKEEISTQKTSWGNLKSFLGKHIQNIVDSDRVMIQKKIGFESAVNDATSAVLKDSKLQSFIEVIRRNYSTNLRNDNCSVDFGLPNYEDIFLKMLFKIGLNGNTENLIPIDQFGDGFISMFVMAVIQSVAESNIQDKCLFLFEEPESFLHENHQEYFYKSVLCGLAEKGHQVIYTTHSDKMIDPFDTKGLIRLEMGKENHTVKKYNDVGEFAYELVDIETGEVINYSKYNEFVKTIEPNLNRILFSKKVILVEGPNDVLVYKYAISEKVLEHILDNESIVNKKKYAETFLNFENISIVCHHGKTTALYLIELCKHFKVEYFVINDWDFEEDELMTQTIEGFTSLAELKEDSVYVNSDKKAMITNNWNLFKSAGADNIHFNIKKLENVIGYGSDDKNSLGIWNILNSPGFVVRDNLFPENLKMFLGLNVGPPLNLEENDLPF